MKILWYFNRLRVMGPKEVIHRVIEQIDLRRLKHTQAAKDKSSKVYDQRDYSFLTSSEPRLNYLAWDTNHLNSDAISLLNAEWPALGFNWRWQQGNWHVSPDSNTQWPLHFFGDINYRSGNPHGDARVVWEPSRLQQLVALALLCQYTEHQEQALTLLKSQLIDWVETNPPYRGVHYISAMECALRLIAVCHAVDIARPYIQTDDDVWLSVVKLVDSHAALIIRRLSLHSSAGNHTIAECTGLVYAGILFPELKGSSQWLQRGLQLLEDEAERQILGDGGSLEQAFGYHLLITDLCHLVVLLLQSKGRPSARLEAKVQQATGFLSCFFNEKWELPAIGDNDGGFALSPYLRISHRSNSDQRLLEVYKQAGYSAIRDQEQQRLLVFDHGALGMAPSFGHGHSDCLSLIWQEQGETLLADCGTFTYTGDEKYRTFFRSVAAHNTVAVNGADQAKQVGAFMWVEPFQAKLIRHKLTNTGIVYLLASHNGYEKFAVTHSRSIVYLPNGNTLIHDELVQQNQKESAICLRWHLDADIRTLSNSAHSFVGVISKNNAELNLCVEGGSVNIHVGENDSMAGWLSPIYGRKRPIKTLEVCHSGNFTHEFYSYIKPGSDSMKEDEKQQLKAALNELRQ